MKAYQERKAEMAKQGIAFEREDGEDIDCPDQELDILEISWKDRINLE